MRRRTLLRRTGALLGTALLALAPTAPANAEGPSADFGSTGAGSAMLTASVEVTYTMPGSAGVASGVSQTTASSVSVAPSCGYKPLRTGREAAEFVKEQPSKKGARMTGALYPGLEDHATDDGAEGYWYGRYCDRSVFPDDESYSAAKDAFWSSTPWHVWVPSGETPPQPPVDPVVLARAAWKATEVPPPSIDRNPKLGDAQATVVGLDTWVWATGQTPQTVTVQATLGTTSVTVTATSDGLRLQAPDAVSSCSGFGTAWQAGMAEGTSDCTIEFTRSSAHLGGTTPVTASASYSATWTSTNGSSGTLDPVTTTSTTNIPVTEIQTINVPTPDH